MRVCVVRCLVAFVPCVFVLVMCIIYKYNSTLWWYVLIQYDKTINSDIKRAESPAADVNFTYLDVLNYDALSSVVVNHKITWLVHLATMLSAIGEQHPQQAMKLNVGGIENVLEVARLHNLRVFAPSTIAVSAVLYWCMQTERGGRRGDQSDRYIVCLTSSRNKNTYSMLRSLRN